MFGRLHKHLANYGLGSRREIERWIVEKRLVVNGQIAHLGLQVSNKDYITLDGMPLRLSTNKLSFQDKVLLYHKSLGEICSRWDSLGRDTVFKQLPVLERMRWIMVGRLDCNTTGLLLFTTNGLLSHRLLHPSYAIEREYAVRVYGTVTPKIVDRLKTGINLQGQQAHFEQIIAQKKLTGHNQWYQVILKEGKKREVRRLWESQGITVSRLKRIRFGPIQLPPNLQPKKYSYLSTEKIMQLKNCVNLH